jgi:hypothetical protein
VVCSAVEYPRNRICRCKGIEHRTQKAIKKLTTQRIREDENFIAYTYSVYFSCTQFSSLISMYLQKFSERLGIVKPQVPPKKFKKKRNSRGGDDIIRSQ